jgi:hypothetical protein
MMAKIGESNLVLARLAIGRWHLGTSMGNIGAIAPARLISSSPPVIQSSEVFKTFGVGVFMIRLIAGETPMDRVDGVDNVD